MDGVFVSESGLNQIKALAVKFTDRRGRGSRGRRGSRGGRTDFMGRTPSTDTNEDEKEEEKGLWFVHSHLMFTNLFYYEFAIEPDQ